MSVGKDGNEFSLDQAINLLKKHRTKSSVVLLPLKNKNDIKEKYLRSNLVPELVKLTRTQNVLIVITSFKDS